MAGTARALARGAARGIFAGASMEGKRVLVVDDEPEIRDFLRDLLSGEGFGVDTAADADVAIRSVRETIYDAALLDFHLPDMNGIMLHRRIRELDPDLADKTVFMSGFVQSDENLDYFVAESGGFLAKPFEIHQIVSVVRGLVGRP